MTINYRKLYKDLLKGTGSKEWALNICLVVADLRAAFFDMTSGTAFENGMLANRVDSVSDILDSHGILQTINAKISTADPPEVAEALFFKNLPGEYARRDIRSFTNQELGEILEYPCPGQIGKPSSTFYMFEVLTGKTKPELLWTAECWTLDQNLINQFEEFVAKIKDFVRDTGIPLKIEAKILKIELNQNKRRTNQSVVWKIT